MGQAVYPPLNILYPCPAQRAMLDSSWHIIAHSSTNLEERHLLGPTDDRKHERTQGALLPYAATDIGRITFLSLRTLPLGYWSCQYETPDRHSSSGKERCSASLQCGTGRRYIVYDKNSTFKKRAGCKCGGANKSSRYILLTVSGVQVHLCQ